MIQRITVISLLFLLWGHFLPSYGQVKYTKPPLSTESNKGFTPCPDTVFKFLFARKVVDLNLILPAWLPVLGYDVVTELEGQIIPKPGSKSIDTHVSPSDFPFHHYTHDVSFNVKPDSTKDNRFTNLLANRVHFDEKTKEPIDTVMMPYVHCEWETGLGAFNDGNPCSELNNAGNSAGFYTAGHQRRDRIWNWPTLGDWVHIEGLWLWDRGHPPARTEIHPARLVALRRKLPAKISVPGDKEVFATKIDIYANGDGGALNNNRMDAPAFVHKVKMGDKDYKFRVQHMLPKPSPNAVLKYVIKKQKGDSFKGKMEIRVYPNGGARIKNAFVEVHIPWKGKSDTWVFARTIYTYWDEDNGIPDDYKIDTYKVTLKALKFRKMKEVFGKSEFRVFLSVNDEFIFLNEFVDVPNILTDGLGSTKKRNWEINQEFTVHLPAGQDFRVHAGGWEADAVDTKMATLMDPYSPCDVTTKKWVNENLGVVSPLKFAGCLDDHIGEINAMHSAVDIGEFAEFEGLTDGPKEADVCIGNNGKQKKIFKLSYTIQKMK
ncbi:MAG: hypothetical protein JKY52_12755 [Flavobacteriales bacterium]|nr:hypothetical protein [Flavobacteriales bacterium]